MSAKKKAKKRAPNRVAKKQDEYIKNDADDLAQPEPQRPPDQREGGRRRKFETEEDYEQAIEDYKDKVRYFREVPNKAGFCYFARISRDTYNEYRERYPDAHKELEEYIENAWIQRLAGTTPTGAIFYLKNAFRHDYKDRHENDVTVSPSSLTKEDIGAAIDKLPEKERDALYVQIATALTGGSAGSAA